VSTDGVDLAAVLAGGAVTYLPPDAPPGLPTVGVPVVVDGPDGD
jgi:hypothetical protein